MYIDLSDHEIVSVLKVKSKWWVAFTISVVQGNNNDATFRFISDSGQDGVANDNCHEAFCLCQVCDFTVHNYPPRFFLQ